MKTWLAKLKISTALDRGTPADNRCKSAEVRRFEQSVRALDRRLRESRPDESVPPGLHSSILRAVRASRAEVRPSARFALRWLPAPALALLVVLGLWWSFTRPGQEPGATQLSREAQPLMAASTVLDQGRKLTQSAPAAALAPLSGEMELLNRDFNSALSFVVASVR